MPRARDVITSGIGVLTVTALLQKDLQPAVLRADEPDVAGTVTDAFPVGKAPRYSAAGRLTGFIDDIKYFFQNSFPDSFPYPAPAGYLRYFARAGDSSGIVKPRSRPDISKYSPMT